MSAKRKPLQLVSKVKPVKTVKLIAGRDAVTPPLLTDRERGQGDSTNARLHKLIGKYRDFALVRDDD